MEMKPRYLEVPLEEHLKQLRQMIFLSGPRQCGKTTLAKKMLTTTTVQTGINYFNWDVLEHRRILQTRIFNGKERLDTPNRERICFDEIHKYNRWKNMLKGLFDKYEPQFTHWLITGSAMLDVYRRGQDSLVGRAFTYHLFPFSVAEFLERIISHKNKDHIKGVLSALEYRAPAAEEEEVQELLFKFSAFPEPLLSQKEIFLKKWRESRLERLIQQDLSATEQIKNLPLVENLMFLLPHKTGNILSINSLREDLEVHFQTVKHWLELLERVYYGFRVKSYPGTLTRLNKKEAKWYLWDWTEIDSPGVRFENMIAFHLFKAVQYWNDTAGEKLNLYFLRDRDHREVDFLITHNQQPLSLIECKLSDENPSSGLLYFAERLKVPYIFVLARKCSSPRTIKNGNIVVQVLPSSVFLSQLGC